MWTHGFLGYDASLMLDVVIVALLLIVPVLFWSVRLARRGKYSLHKRIQLTLAVILLLAVAAFEVDLQIVHGGWERVVNKDPDLPRLPPERMSFVRQVLWVHLVFAVSTPVLWVFTIALALRRMPAPPQPSAHSSLHKILGWTSTIDLTLTTISGMTFYYFAFVA